MAGETIDFSIESITFSGGSRIEFGANDLVVVVGPNNAGKSAAIREVWTRLQAHPGTMPMAYVVTSGMSIRKTDQQPLVWETLKAIGRPRPSAHPDALFYNNIGATQDAVIVFVQNRESLAPLAPWFAMYIDTQSRFSLAAAQEAIDFGIQEATHPLHRLHQDAGLMSKLNRWFKRAFGSEIAVDHFAGRIVPLHVGPDVAPKEGESVTSEAYRERLRSRPRLDTQGDGMRGFVGLLIHALLGHHTLHLIDEPEAFLHPPQARLLGRLFADNHSQGQTFVATHSVDFLRGVLEAKDRNVRVLRVSRQDDQNFAADLSPDDVRELWDDPVLRYSNILDGVFHEKVIICEADGDCRFYGAVADSLREADNHPYVRDVMFAQSGGKGGVAKLVKALRGLNVPIAAIVDFDAILSTGQLRTIVEAFGGDWTNYNADYREVKRSIDELGKLSPDRFRARALDIIDRIDGNADEVTKATRSDFQRLLKDSIGAARAKESGIGVLDRDARVAAERLLGQFADLGLFIVPSGEMESFVVQEAAEKNAWVAAVLEQYGQRLATANELANAREFIGKIIARE